MTFSGVNKVMMMTIKSFQRQFQSREKIAPEIIFELVVQYELKDHCNLSILENNKRLVKCALHSEMTMKMYR